MSYSHSLSKLDFLGILGGMGPLASAEFLKTIYEYSLTGKREQKSPKVVVYSDPTLPDRTQILLSGKNEPLLSQLIEALYQLSGLKVTKIIICCITSHYLLPKLSSDLQQRIVSLVDIVLSNIIEQKTRHLLLCTTGTRQLEIFSRHPLWEQAKDYIVLPNETDQQTIHSMIYQIKTNSISIPIAYQRAERLTKKYNVNSVIAGCTELHLLSKFSKTGGEVHTERDIQITFLDPLIQIAQKLASESLEMNENQLSVPSVSVHEVKLSHLQIDKRPPLVIEPTTDDLDLVAWANNNQGVIESQLATYGALLFRGFKLPSPTTLLEQFALTNCSDLFSDNGEHPREALGSKVYTPVFYPNDKKIFWHNENSFNRRSPMRIWFCCLRPSEQGGETPIVDSREVYNLIDSEIREEFERKQVMYIRNYNPQLGLSWQDVFQTTDKKEVEKKCQDNLMSFEWKEGDRLKTTCIRPSVVKHPKTGEMSWFNQAQHWHLYFLDPVTREVFLSSFSEDELPRNCCYGDGSPIPDTAMEAVEKAYQKLEISFPWQKEDILMLDNILMAHARNPFVGERKLLVTMGGMFQYDC